MIIAAPTVNESDRLDELESYKLIGLSESEDYDFITSMAAQICGTKISLVSLITEDEQWFLSHHGIETKKTPKDFAFCTHAIKSPNDPLIVENALEDERFYNNPLTTGDPHVIFYVGIPLLSSNGYPLGTLCAIDDVPKTINHKQLEQLKQLAQQTVKLFELRKQSIQLDVLNRELERKNQLLLSANEVNELGSWEMDIKAEHISWTDKAYEIFGVPTSFDINKIDLPDFYFPEYRSTVSKSIANCINNDIPFNLVCKITDAKNNIKWIRITGKKTYQKLVGSYQDLTDIKHDEVRFKSILEGTNVGTWEWNVQTGETIFNETWAQIVGYTLEELKPINIDTWLKLAHPEDLEESSRRLNDCFEKKTIFYEFETRMKHKDGHWVWVYERGKVFEWTKEGKPLIMYGTHQDITEQKKSSNLLSKLSTKFAHLKGKSFFDSVSKDAAHLSGLDFVFVGKINPDRKTVTVLGGYAKGQKMESFTYDLEFTPCENVVGKEACIYPNNIQEKFPLDHLLKEMGIEGYYGFPLFSKENEAVGLMAGLHSKEIENGKTIEKLFYTYSDRVSAEMQRSFSEETNKELINRFEHIGNNIPGMIFQYKLLPDGSSCFPYVSNGIKNIYGLTPDQVKQNASAAFQVIHPDDIERVTLSIQNSAKNLDQWQDNYRVNLPSGEMIWVEGSATPELHKDGSILWHGFIQNITKRKEADRLLQEAVSRLQAILDASKNFTIVATDTTGKINLFNSGAEERLGYKPDEIIGKHNPSIFHLREELESESKALSKKYNKEIKGMDVFTYESNIGELSTKEWTHVRKDGTTIPVLLSINPIQIQNEIVGYLGVAADISDLKKVEKEIRSLLDVTKEQNDRLRNFAQIVSHNLRSHSSGISEILKLINLEFPDIKQNELIKYLDRGVNNLNQTVSDLNEIIKVNLSVNQTSKINIYDVLQKNIESLSLQIKKANLKIINKVDKKLVINTVPAYMDSIALNMISNAIKYRCHEKTSYLKVSMVEEDAAVTLLFEDNGKGIDLNRHGDQLFGMYKTFHNHKDSRGVGLFITKNQIHSMNGKITAESTVGIGTTFKIVLPK